jgi:DNA-binding NarL/FixJ family response regulator
VSAPRGAKPRLLIADHPVTRLGVRIALDSTVNVCAEADDAENAISAAEREQPDICLVGIGLPGGGIPATRGICKVAPSAAVVVLAAAPDTDDLQSSIHAGAIGYVSSDISALSLGRVVDAVTAGEAAIPRSMVLALVRELQGGSAGGESLTTRERQVLGLLQRGQSTGQIADRLGISPVTVRRHISGTMHKVGVAGRDALARADLLERTPTRRTSAQGAGTNSQASS